MLDWTISKVERELVIANFENLLELNPQTRFMSLYYIHITQDISPTENISNRVCFSDLSNSVQFDLSMTEKFRGIPEHHRSMIAPLIYAAKLDQIKAARTFFTDGSIIEESAGYNEFHSATRQLQAPSSVYVAELVAIHFTLETIASLPPEDYFIFTDSLSSVEAIRSMRPAKHSSS